MTIAVLGTGSVGQTIATRLVELGHTVMMGSRLANNEKGQEWANQAGANASSGTFAEAAAAGDLVILATKGEGALNALQLAGSNNLAAKTVIDLTNPLDFSNGMPPTLSVCNTDSLAEQLQREFPEARIVKSLNTMWAGLMVNPAMLAGGDHTVFVSGNDAGAKAQTNTLLGEFGWQPGNIIDLGDISTARGTEMLLPIWLRLWGALGIAAFNLKVVR